MAEFVLDVEGMLVLHGAELGLCTQGLRSERGEGNSISKRRREWPEGATAVREEGLGGLWTQNPQLWL